MLHLKRTKIRLQYLITGTGRCGTTYMARLLTSLGYMCGHESIFTTYGINAAENKIYFQEPIETSVCSTKNLIVNEPYEDWFDPNSVKAESSYMAAPFLTEKFLKSTKIIHLVRNPLNVLSSFLYDVKFFDYEENNMDKYKNFVLKYLPEITSIENHVERACYYYICWNQMIEKSKYTKKYLLHKVENQCNDELCDFLGIAMPDNFFSDSSMNSWKRDRENNLTLDDIPNGLIKQDFIKLMSNYGYLQ